MFTERLEPLVAASNSDKVNTAIMGWLKRQARKKGVKGGEVEHYISKSIPTSQQYLLDVV
jgi:hypothetical protein